MLPASLKTRLGYAALALIAAVALALVFAPGMVGRLLGGLWVTVMGAVTGLLAGIFAG